MVKVPGKKDRLYMRYSQLNSRQIAFKSAFEASWGAERGCFEAVSGLLAPTKAGKEVLEDRKTFRGHLGIVLILQLHAG